MPRCFIIPASRLLEFDIFITPQWRLSPVLIRGGIHTGSYAVDTAILDAAPEAAKLKAMFTERRADAAKWAAILTADLAPADLAPPEPDPDKKTK